MKIAHWTMFNNSGMFRVAESFAKAECMLGLDSWLVNFADENSWEDILDADIHVVHTHLPDTVRLRLTKPLKIVWVAHGTPEYVFHRSVEAGLNNGYGASDSWQLCQYWMQNSDAIITFWPRHQKIWQSLCDKNTQVTCLPMGIDTSFWKPTESRGKYLGAPSLFTAENCDYSKWPLDLFIAWPWVWPSIPTAHLHSVYLPTDQHRWFYPLINRNGCGFKTISAGVIFDQDNLRNAFCSTDYFIGLVRYGDANRLSLEACATGCKMITYAGNEYADYWITEGDQRVISEELKNILSGKVTPRKKKEVTDVAETAKMMKEIYERILV
jgi:hypothetical protein